MKTVKDIQVNKSMFNSASFKNAKVVTLKATFL